MTVSVHERVFCAFNVFRALYIDLEKVLIASVKDPTV